MTTTQALPPRTPRPTPEWLEHGNLDRKIAFILNGIAAGHGVTLA
ncbi:hypothetical protein HMPREF3227_02643 [Corynebacterium sp. CMW7794]|nr:hypothetical protein HMPREF0307_02532 [Corynebacterium sp. DNF00584]KXI15019.1 hypothetical protein HMPREF3227_02643 [Corynebacterium sp. CMW7794]